MRPDKSMERPVVGANREHAPYLTSDSRTATIHLKSIKAKYLRIQYSDQVSSEATRDIARHWSQSCCMAGWTMPPTAQRQRTADFSECHT
jgi:hypothetical protein